MSLTKVTYAMIEGATANVLDFNAVGDGVADDTAAIQAAINSLSATGGGVYLPTGTYKITASLSINAANITFYGDGFEATTIKATASTFWMLQYTDNSDNLNVNNIFFDGCAVNETNTQYAIGYTLVADAPEYVTIQNCKFSNTNNAIVTGSGKYWLISDCVFVDLIGVTAGRGYGILAAENTYACIFSNNRFNGSAGKGRHAIYMGVGCSYSIASNNTIIDFNTPAIVNRADAGQPGVIANVITGNTIRGGGDPTTPEAAAIFVSGVASYNIVSNNLIENFGNSGITISDAGNGGVTTNNVVDSNRIINADLFGILIIGAKNTSVTNNFIYNVSQDSSGVYRAISVRSQGTFGAEVCTNTKVVNNISYGANQRSCLQLDTGAPVPTGTVVTGNTFFAGATAGQAVELNLASISVDYAFNITDQSPTLGFSDIKQTLSRNATLNFPSIPANSTDELTRAIVGVDTTGWTVLATPEGGTIEAGLVWCAYVSAAGVVTVRVANVTGGAIDPASRGWWINCFRDA
jgi:hypothetical protein